MFLFLFGAFQVVLVVKSLPANAGDVKGASLIPGFGRTPGRGCMYRCLTPPPTHNTHTFPLCEIVIWEKKGISLVVVQSPSCVRVFATLWTAACQGSLSFIISQSLLKLMSVESVLLSNHLVLCRPLLFTSSIFPSIRVSSSDLALCIRWHKYWSFSFSISLSTEYSGLISFRIDWFDLLAVQGTLKSLLQQQNSKASIHQHPAFFIVRL